MHEITLDRNQDLHDLTQCAINLFRLTGPTNKVVLDNTGQCSDLPPSCTTWMVARLGRRSTLNLEVDEVKGG